MGYYAEGDTHGYTKEELEMDEKELMEEIAKADARKKKYIISVHVDTEIEVDDVDEAHALYQAELILQTDLFDVADMEIREANNG